VEGHVGHAVNQSGLVALLQFVAPRSKGRIPLAYASSAAVRPNFPSAKPPWLRPLSGCGADKLGCESHAWVASEPGGIATFGLRLFNVYGLGRRPESPYAGVVSIFADRSLRSDLLNIHGDGSQSRDSLTWTSLSKLCSRH
jgi:UDP-glucose 4-epimerase